MYKDELKAMRDSLIKEIREMVVTALKNRAERAHAEEEKRWSKYEDAYEWERTEEKYNIWKNGDYLNNHIHITIEETEVNPSFYLS